MAVHPSSSVQAVRQALAERRRELRLDVSPKLTDGAPLQMFREELAKMKGSWIATIEAYRVTS